MNVGGGGYAYRLEIGSDNSIIISSDGEGFLGSTVVGTPNTRIATPATAPRQYTLTPTPYFQCNSYAVAVDPTTPANKWVMLGFSENDYPLSALWNTTNSGLNWNLAHFFGTTDAANNTHGHGVMAVDPANSSVVYLSWASVGTLQFTTNGGSTFSTAITAAAQVTGNTPPICGICFDTTSGTTGGQTNRVLCGVNTGSSPGVIVKNSSNVWSLISGSPMLIFDIKMASDGYAYVITSTGGGSLNSGDALYRISPTNTVSSAFTISGASVGWMCVDPNNPAHGFASDTTGGGVITFNGALNGGTIPTGTHNGSEPYVICTDAPWLSMSADPFPGAAAWDPLLFTSTSSVTIGTGSLTWTGIGTGLNIVVGDIIRMSVTGSLTNYVLGSVTSYTPASGGTLVLAAGNADETTHDSYSWGSGASDPAGGVFLSRLTGASGITVTVNSPGSPSVSVSGNAITVTPQTGNASVNAVLAQIRANSAANALVIGCPIRGGTGNMPTLSSQALSGHNSTAPYLGTATGGSGTFTTWTGTKERIWISTGASLVYLDSPPFGGPIIYQDQGFGIETLSGQGCVWTSGEGPLFTASDFPLFPVTSNPVGVTTGLPFYGPQSVWNTISDGINACSVSQTPGVYFGTYGKSTDGGKTWTAFGGSTGLSGVPSHAATTTSNIIAAPTGSGTAVYSTNGGTTWTASTGGPTSWPGPGAFFSYTNPLVADFVNPNYFYGVGTSSGSNFIYYSTNIGATWNQGASIQSFASGNFSAIAAVPGNHGHVFMTTGTEDRGNQMNSTTAVYNLHPFTGGLLFWNRASPGTVTALPNVLEPLCVAVGGTKFFSLGGTLPLVLLLRAG